MSSNSVVVKRRSWLPTEKQLDAAAGKVFWLAFWCFILWVIVAGIFQWATYPKHAYKTYFSAGQYLADSGLPANHGFPLKLGAPTTVELTNSTSPHFFLLTGKDAVAQGLQPSSNVRIVLQIGTYSHIMEVAFGQIIPHARVGTKPTLHFTIDNSTVDRVNPWLTSWTAGSFFTLQTRHMTAAQPTIRDSREWKRLQRLGIGTLLDNQLRNVYITMSPQLYARFLGGS